MSNGINDLVKEAYGNAKEKGWWDEPRNDFELMALIHSEVSEVVEDLRVGKVGLNFEENGKPIGVPSELADILIRVFDYCGARGIDLEQAVRLKMAYNKTRPYRHGGKLA